MFNVIGNEFLNLLKEFQSAGKEVTLIHSSLGPLTGKLIKINQDVIGLKVLDRTRNSFYNEFMPSYTIVNVEIEDNDNE